MSKCEHCNGTGLIPIPKIQKPQKPDLKPYHLSEDDEQFLDTFIQNIHDGIPNDIRFVILEGSGNNGKTILRKSIDKYVESQGVKIAKSSSKVLSLRNMVNIEHKQLVHFDNLRNMGYEFFLVMLSKQPDFIIETNKSIRIPKDFRICVRIIHMNHVFC